MPTCPHLSDGICDYCLEDDMPETVTYRLDQTDEFPLFYAVKGAHVVSETNYYNDVRDLINDVESGNAQWTEVF